eukprot:3742702-Pyramimonas_sp.AAC.4
MMVGMGGGQHCPVVEISAARRHCHHSSAGTPIQHKAAGAATSPCADKGTQTSVGISVDEETQTQDDAAAPVVAIDKRAHAKLNLHCVSARMPAFEAFTMMQVCQ